MIRSALRVIIASVIAVSCIAQIFPPEVMESGQSITPREIQAHVNFLADDLLEGRDTGSRGHEIAASYVASQFLAAGLEPAGTNGGWFQPVPLRSAELESATMEMRVGRRWMPLAWKEDFAVVADPERTRSSVEGEVVFVGFGITAPEMGWDDYAGVDVRNRIVIALRNAPSVFPSSQRAHYASTSEKRRNAAAHGASGLIELSSPREEERVSWPVLAGYSDHPTMRWIEPDGDLHEGLFGLRAHARISRAGAEKIFKGSEVSLDELFEKADRGERTGSFPIPGEIRIQSSSQHQHLESPNVIGMVRGSDPDLRDELVLLIAHLDHVGRRGDEIYNGAYDNASGVAALLAVAEAFGRLEKAPLRSIGFLAVTGEEKGLLGADYFAHAPTEPVGEIVAAFSLDMFLMLFPMHDIVAFGAEHSSLGGSVAAAAGAMGVSLSPDYAPEEVLFVRTDHYPFVKRGVPALYLDHGLETGDPAIDGQELVRNWMKEVYHKPGDDLTQYFDWTAGADFARLNLLLAWKVASDPERPTWNEGDFFGERFGTR